MSTNYGPTSSCGNSSSGLTAQGALSVADDAVVMPTMNCGCVGFQLFSGAWSGTVTFEGTIDGVNWVAINADPMPTGSATTTATAQGLFQVPCAGLSQVRARLSTATSGSITITGNTSLAPRST